MPQPQDDVREREAFEKSFAQRKGWSPKAVRLNLGESTGLYYHSFIQDEWEGWQARQPEIDALKKRVEELEQTFRHYHVRSDNGDQCAQCKRDLRDAVHARSTPTPVASHE